MASIKLKKVKKNFGETVVVKNSNLEIKEGEFVVFLGPSGCGKTTTLRMIAGLEDISDGEIWIDGMSVNNTPPKDRGIAMVFQNYALYPHMTVKQNMRFALGPLKLGREENEKRIAEAATVLELESLLNRKPAQLSGGQRQRVAMGRAMVRTPKVFLFDEPLSNLDAKLRTQVRWEIAKLHKRLKSTIIYVTHDQVEAMTLATKIVVMKDGQIEQVGAPEEIYANPKNTFVATFVGSPAMNLLGAEIKSEFIESGSIRIPLPQSLKGKVGTSEKVILGVRPNTIACSLKGNSNQLQGRVLVREYLGNTTQLNLQCGSEELIVEIPAEVSIQVNDQVFLNVDEKTICLFREDTKQLIQ